MWKSDFGRIKIKKYEVNPIPITEQKMTHKLIKSFGFSSTKDYLMSCFVNTEKAKI